ncbi:TRAPP complex subunit [Mycena chlorophos]|uniref:TRAPP complex subunit n=1 Tax=Mycena chlorophos TaxID=658473 RepID=A0A8H6RY17_MYCCL|nr:TRAPP complex subunit [Mycena chlorophos]
MAAPAQFAATRTLDNTIVLYLSPNQPTVPTPAELKEELKDEVWVSRVQQLTTTAARFNKLWFERIWLLAGILAIFIVPVVVYPIIANKLFGNEDDVTSRQIFEARGISFALFFGLVLFVFVPLAIFKFLGQQQVNALLRKWEQEDKAKHGNVPMSKWTVQSPGVFRSSTILRVQLPAGRSLSVSNFTYGAYMPSFIGQAPDKEAQHFYQYQDTKGRRPESIGNRLIGSSRLFLPAAMTIYSLYVFDRHCTTIYYHDFHRTRRPKPAVQGAILPAVSQAVSTPHHSNPSVYSAFSSPRNTLASSSGVVVAVNEAAPAPPSPLLMAAPASPAPVNITSTGLSFDEESKLVYGVILSLRNMIKKISGKDEQFTSYRTSSYKLHLYETVSGYKFVMLSDPASDSLRFILRQIYVGPFLEYVVRNPLVQMDSKEYGIDNEYFRASVDRLVRSSHFS